MSLPKQIGAYKDCFELFEKAKADEVGARAQLPTQKAAYVFQMRMHQARALEREESRKAYKSFELPYNKSEFDDLIVTIKEDTEGCWWVYVERHGAAIIAIETLSELEPDLIPVGEKR